MTETAGGRRCAPANAVTSALCVCAGSAAVATSPGATPPPLPPFSYAHGGAGAGGGPHSPSHSRSYQELRPAGGAGAVASQARDMAAPHYAHLDEPLFKHETRVYSPSGPPLPAHHTTDGAYLARGRSSGSPSPTPEDGAGADAYRQLQYLEGSEGAYLEHAYLDHQHALDTDEDGWAMVLDAMGIMAPSLKELWSYIIESGTTCNVADERATTRYRGAIIARTTDEELAIVVRGGTSIETSLRPRKRTADVDECTRNDLTN
ncbi:hypothetical protein EVAR_61077_1 [Eumeta japonica]|uniref:Uncharacterized protein n=1 Tax=Eumeta variegata TaxID=151549 RepID=A0A4C1YRU9_EUMVA|nr:hypothetical protein EVAR_61077_1 [Eumeta japonica]